MLRWVWSVWTNGWVVTAAYWVVLTVYYGFNLVPESDGEMIAQGLGYLMVVVSSRGGK